MTGLHCQGLPNIMSQALKYILLPLFFTISLISITQADFLIMKNGDKISGEIQSMTPSQVVIHLPYAGNINVTRSEISEIHTSTPVMIMLKDKTLEFGKFNCQKTGRTIILDTVTGEEHEYPLSSVTYINPPPHIAGEGTYFSGEINLGGEFKEGNTVSTKIGVDFNTQYDKGIRRWLFNGKAQWESKNRTNTEENWFLQGRYNRLFKPKWYTLGNMSLEYDKFKGLDLRSVTGGGVGYRFFDEPERRLSIEGGPNFVFENYKETGKSYYLAFREGGQLQYPFFRNRLFFYHNHSLLQGISDTAQLSIRTSTGFKIPIGILGIHTALQLDWNWDKEPSPGRKNSDTTLTLKGGYGW